MMKKLLLFFAAVMVAGSMMADVTLYSTDFSSADWSDVTFSQGSSSNPDVINGVTFYGKNSTATKNFSISNGALVFPDNNIAANNYFLAIPVTGVNGQITISVSDGTNNTRIKYDVKEGTTVVYEGLSTSNATNAGNPTTATIADLTASNYVVYIGRQGSGYKQITSIKITTADPLVISAPAFTSVAAAPTSAEVNTDIVLTATATGYPVPSLQWYSCDAQGANGVAVEGATNNTLTVNKAEAGTYYYYCVATNSEGTATSDVVAVEFTGHIASNACKLLQVVYSNTFDAFITEPKEETEEAPAADGMVKAYYMEGETEPTITSVRVSEAATYTNENGVITVTAEDGVTTAIYNITVASVAPYAGTGVTFDGTETWVKNGGGFAANKGVIISKTDTDWSREAAGKTRAYFFLDECESVTLTNGLVDTNRDMKYSINGGAKTSFTLGKKSGSTNFVTIDLSSVDGPAMICVESNQTSGDAGFSKIEVVRPAAAESYTLVANSNNWASLALPFDAVVPEGCVVYYAKAKTAEVITLSPLAAGAVLPKEEGVIVKKADADANYTFVEAESAATALTSNLLFNTANAAATVTERSVYVLNATTSTADAPVFSTFTGTTIPAKKAYLPIATTGGVAPRFVIEGTEEATAVENVEAADVVKFIENGQVLIKKNGAVYNVMGQIMK